jgi:hypothetical protein
MEVTSAMLMTGLRVFYPVMITGPFATTEPPVESQAIMMQTKRSTTLHYLLEKSPIGEVFRAAT